MGFDAYIICATPRTGSTLLCDLLASTGKTGSPDSFFSGRFMPSWADQWGVTPADVLGEPRFSKAYLMAAIEAGKGASSMFGLRLMRDSVDELDALIDRVYPGFLAGKVRHEKAFGTVRYIHLFRGDKLAQAVSLVKAEQTGLWHVAPDGSEIERMGPPGEPAYDFDRLHREIEKLESDDLAWSSWFSAQGISPLRINYEDLSTDPASALMRICGDLGVAAPDRANIRPGVAKLADAVSRQWLDQYRHDAGLI